jgi:hypothetical protein
LCLRQQIVHRKIYGSIKRHSGRGGLWALDRGWRGSAGNQQAGQARDPDPTARQVSAQAGKTTQRKIRFFY